MPVQVPLPVAGQGRPGGVVNYPMRYVVNRKNIA